LGTAATTHCTAAFMTHAGQAVAGFVLSSLAVAQKNHCYQQERKGDGQGKNKS